MADIELVIKISEEDYKKVLDTNNREWDWNNMHSYYEAILDGMPLPKGHGALIDKEELKENINGWYAFMKDVCKQSYMTLKQEEIIGKIDIMTPIIEADKEQENGNDR